MTEKELLKLAAKAADIEIHESDDGTLQRHPIWAMTHYVQGQPYGETRWNPLQDDCQALRLAVKLGMDVCIDTPQEREPITHAIAFVGAGSETVDTMELHGDPYAATRRAIVRAAAEIGKTIAEKSA